MIDGKSQHTMQIRSGSSACSWHASTEEPTPTPKHPLSPSGNPPLSLTLVALQCCSGAGIHHQPVDHRVSPSPSHHDSYLPSIFTQHSSLLAMSFGASPSDIIIVVTFARRLYRSCRNAGGEYLEISREVRGLHTVLRYLKYEVEDSDSILNREKARYGRELAPVIDDCDHTLRQLDELLVKYGRLSQSDGSGAGRLWDKIRFGSNELDDLGSIRMKLINHKTSITMFLDTIQLHESGRMSTTLHNQTGQLDVILDKVDNIAARMGQRAGSIMTTYDDDDKEVWKQFRRELVAEGFSSDILQQHKVGNINGICLTKADLLHQDVLRAYIRDIDQRSITGETRLDSAAPPQSGIDPEQWLEEIPTVQSPDTNGIPPSFSSLNVNTNDTEAKILIQEENLKFPQSMKYEIARQAKAVLGDASKQLYMQCSH